jgi:hypothetical protein
MSLAIFFSLPWPVRFVVLFALLNNLIYLVATAVFVASFAWLLLSWAVGWLVGWLSWMLFGLFDQVVAVVLASGSASLKFGKRFFWALHSVSPLVWTWRVLKFFLSLALVLANELFWLPWDLFLAFLGPWFLGGLSSDAGSVVVPFRGGWARLDSLRRRTWPLFRWWVLLPAFAACLFSEVPVVSLRLVRAGVWSLLPDEFVVSVELVWGFVDLWPVTRWVVSFLLGASLVVVDDPSFGEDHFRDLVGVVSDEVVFGEVVSWNQLPKTRPQSLREWEAFCRGKRIADAEGVALVAACGVGGATPRLRARGRLACRLQATLGGGRGCVGMFLRGRWAPDLPASERSPALNAILTVHRGLKVLGVGTFPTLSGSDGDFVLVESQEGDRRIILPSLSGLLSKYSQLRRRDAKLLEMVRSRAIRWFKDVEAPSWVPSLCLASSVADAFDVSDLERVASTRLAGAFGEGILLGEL